MIYTIGHSTFPAVQFGDMLTAAGVATLLDTRSHPGSKWPWHRKEEMERWLPAEHGVGYEWWPQVGGWLPDHAPLAAEMAAHGVQIAPYLGRGFPKQRIAATEPPAEGGPPRWTNTGLRDYSYYMATPGFLDGVDALIERGACEHVAIMCCECQWWRALPVDEPVLTPTGWRPMGVIKVGDFVIGGDGMPVAVTDIPFRGIAQTYRVNFNDGTSVHASRDHQWTVEGWRGRNVSITVDTVELQRLVGGRSRFGWSLPALPPVQYAAADPLPMDPYLLGVLLGDGQIGPSTPRWTGLTADVAVVERIRAATADTITSRPHPHSAVTSVHYLAGNRTRAALQALGIFGLTGAAKTIPERYLRASVEDRYALLQGLMDSDGTVDRRCTRVVFYNTARGLADGVLELVRSLGGTARLTQRNRGSNKTQWKVTFRTPECPFSLPRKVQRWKTSTRSFRRRVVSVEDTGEMAESQCITVANPDGLFVTRDYVVTHNCHRSLIADLLAYRGVQSLHIMPRIRQKNRVKFVDGIKVKPHSDCLGNRLQRYEDYTLAAWAERYGPSRADRLPLPTDPRALAARQLPLV